MSATNYHSVFKDTLSSDQILIPDTSTIHYGKDWTKGFNPNPSLILLPNTYDEVKEIVSLANKFHIPLVPSSGRTGLAGGAYAQNGEVILALDRLNKIISFDDAIPCLTVQASVKTETVQNEARERGFRYAIDLTSRGSCTIGGNISTNAGGMYVIRYGHTRDQILGLKVVTGKGELLEVSPLVKNRSGYDLKHLFIGSEGTLGVVVEVTLRLHPQPTDSIRVMFAVSSIEAIGETLATLKGEPYSIGAFEFLEGSALELVLQHHPELKSPFSKSSPFYVVVQLEDNSSVQERVELTLSKLLSKKVIEDAVMSASAEQYKNLMAFRELVGETTSTFYTPHKNDLAVPVHSIGKFLSELRKTANTVYKGFKSYLFGHFGDGNVHINVIKPEEMELSEFKTVCRNGDKETFKLVRSFRGSIAAEHGIGLVKKDFLAESVQGEQLAIMRQLKAVFDPNGVLNPGKIFV